MDAIDLCHKAVDLYEDSGKVIRLAVFIPAKNLNTISVSNRKTNVTKALNTASSLATERPRIITES
jgi:hypothetical protein